MTKLEQETINNAVLKALEQYDFDVKCEVNDFSANSERLFRTVQATEKCAQLRYSSATVYENEKYAVLRSYNTVIAIIDKTTDTLYDFLRYVYGFTSTSAQHIAKFDKDYCRGTWGCANRLTYKAI